MSKYPTSILCIALLLTGCWAASPDPTQSPAAAGDLEERVRRFLDGRRGTWHDMNVPESDGRTLHDIIVKNNYRRALEIGTSTGHSGTWIALALSKTGGKLITVDIDRGRHEQAVANFKAAGVDAYIDARLGDAHEIVPALQGPFDFVFSDADKDWYINYLKAVLPKLSVGGCFVSHNVSEGRRRQGSEYLAYVRSLLFMETSVVANGGGMAVSYRRAEK